MADRYRPVLGHLQFGWSYWIVYLAGHQVGLQVCPLGRADHCLPILFPYPLLPLSSFLALSLRPPIGKSRNVPASLRCCFLDMIRSLYQSRSFSLPPPLSLARSQLQSHRSRHSLRRDLHRLHVHHAPRLGRMSRSHSIPPRPSIRRFTRCSPPEGKRGTVELGTEVPEGGGQGGEAYLCFEG